MTYKLPEPTEISCHGVDIEVYTAEQVQEAYEAGRKAEAAQAERVECEKTCEKSNDKD